MTQDQYGQGQGAGSVVRGEVVPDDDADETQPEQAVPATHFQKVAPSPDAPGGHDGSDQTPSGEVGAVRSRDAGDRDDQDDPDRDAVPAGQAGVPAGQAGVPAGQAGVPAEPELRPGDTGAALSDVGDLAYGSLLPDAPEFQQRWHQVQFRFVDDPPGSVTEAADVIAQATAKLEAAIAERQRSLRARWGEGTSGDTETLRATLLMYRAFLDQLTGAR
jgi:hypothetical protein